jgi:hypothetical protein
MRWHFTAGNGLTVAVKNGTITDEGEIYSMYLMENEFVIDYQEFHWISDHAPADGQIRERALDFADSRA